MAVSTKTTRKTAPKIEVNLWEDKRKSLLDKLDAENPGFIHMYASRSDSVEDLAQGHKEIVMEGDTDRPYSNAGDPVVRMPRDIFLAEREAMERRSLESAGSVVERIEDDQLIASPKKSRS